MGGGKIAALSLLLASCSEQDMPDAVADGARPMAWPEGGISVIRATRGAEPGSDDPESRLQYEPVNPGDPDSAMRVTWADDGEAFYAICGATDGSTIAGYMFTMGAKGASGSVDFHPSRWKDGAFQPSPVPEGYALHAVYPATDAVKSAFQISQGQGFPEDWALDLTFSGQTGRLEDISGKYDYMTATLDDVSESSVLHFDYAVSLLHLKGIELVPKDATAIPADAEATISISGAGIMSSLALEDFPFISAGPGEITLTQKYPLSSRGGKHCLDDDIYVAFDPKGVSSLVVTANVEGVGDFAYAKQVENLPVGQIINLADLRADEMEPESFSFVVRMEAGKSCYFSTETFVGKFTIDWGDGSSTTVYPEPQIREDQILAPLRPVRADAWDPQFSHTYADAGDYTVTMTGWKGMLPMPKFSVSTNLIAVNDALPQSKGTSLKEEFHGCHDLASIPADLFAKNPNATDFSNVFTDCRSLTAFPPGIFANNTAVTSFSHAFRGCTSLTVLPQGLFDNCPNVTDFGSTFEGCTSLTAIPAGLFDSNPNVTRFSCTFSGCSSLTGQAPELWERTNVYGEACFRNCTNLANYSSIPSSWK